MVASLESLMCFRFSHVILEGLRQLDDERFAVLVALIHAPDTLHLIPEPSGGV